ncbi:YbbR-like domain-containing protein [Acidobacteriota bacterium]
MLKQISHRIFRNFHLKIISMLIAFGMWYFVTGEEQVLQDFTIPIQYRNLPDTVILSGEKLETVKVRIQAPDSIISKLAESDIDIKLDLSEAKLGTQFFRLTPEHCRVPYGVKVADLYPAALTLNLENKVEKSIEIKPQIEGTPAPGFELKQIRAIPAAVRIVGAASEVEPIESATTGAISVEGRKESFNERITLDVGNPNVRILTPDKTSVAVVISERMSTKLLSDIPVSPVGCDHRVSLQPESVTVTLQGPILVLDHILPENIVARVDLTGCKRGESLPNQPVLVELKDVPSKDKIEVVAPEKIKTSCKIN